LNRSGEASWGTGDAEQQNLSDKGQPRRFALRQTLAGDLERTRNSRFLQSINSLTYQQNIAMLFSNLA